MSYCNHPKRVKTHTRSGFELELGSKHIFREFVKKKFSPGNTLIVNVLSCGRLDRYEKGLTKYLVETEDTVEYNQEYEECVESRLEVDVTSNVPFPVGPKSLADTKDSSNTKASGKSDAESDGQDEEVTSSSSEGEEDPPKKHKRTKSPQGRDAKRQKRLEDEPEDRVLFS